LHNVNKYSTSTVLGLLLTTAHCGTSNMSSPIAVGHFSTLVLHCSLFCWTLLFLMCLQSCAFAHIISQTFW